jgi:hypothetical protein
MKWVERFHVKQLPKINHVGTTAGSWCTDMDVLGAGLLECRASDCNTCQTSLGGVHCAQTIRAGASRWHPAAQRPSGPAAQRTADSGTRDSGATHVPEKAVSKPGLPGGNG